MCGCRKPEQVEALANASKICLNEEEIRILETAADSANVRIMGADIFKRFVLKPKKK